MLRTLSRQFAALSRTRSSWVSLSTAVDVAPPKPPAHLPAEQFEWDFLLKNAETEEEKKEIQNLKNLFVETELLNKKDFKLTVDWKEFEGKVPQGIIEKYQQIHADAVKDFEAGKFDIKLDEEEWEKASKELMSTVHSIVKESKTRVAELEEEIKKTEGKLARLKTATVEEEMALDPELAKRVDDEVSKELGYTP